MKADAYYESYWSEEGYLPHGAPTWHLRRLLRAHVAEGAKVLDLGCGDGGTAGDAVRARGCAYLGVDVSENAVRRARGRGFDARRIDDAGSLPFEGDSFDAVLAIEVLEHLFLPHLAAAEVHRVLKPGGVFILSVPNVAYWRRRLDLAAFGRWNPFGDDLSVEQPWRDPHIRFFNPASMKRLLTLVGFGDVQVNGHGGALLRDIPVARRLCRGEEPSRLFRAAERRAPALLAAR
ncbi:MAG TPA: class I SAM-dependent methyltransferase, partial [Actinomycetes bacterium]